MLGFFFDICADSRSPSLPPEIALATEQGSRPCPCVDWGLILPCALAVKLNRQPFVAVMTSELDLYDYDLPRHLIAQSPVTSRTDARLLVVDRAAKSFRHKHIRDLPEIQQTRLDAETTGSCRIPGVSRTSSRAFDSARSGLARF